MKQLIAFHDITEETDLDAVVAEVMAAIEGSRKEPVKKHEPGGQSHDQSNHGVKGTGSASGGRTPTGGKGVNLSPADMAATAQADAPFLDAAQVPTEDQAFVTEIYNQHLAMAGTKIQYISDNAGMDQMSIEGSRRGIDTMGMYGEWDGNEFGGYSEDRGEWQSQVLSNMENEQAAANGMDPLQERKAVVMLGLPGSGKSFLIKNELNEHIDTREYLTINADDVKTHIIEGDTPPEIEDVNGMELSSMVHEESSTMRKAWEATARAKGTNVILDVTGANRSKTLGALGKLKDAGYHITLVHADVSIAEAKASALARAATGGEGDTLGRIAPERFIQGMASSDFEGHDVIDLNFDDYLPLANTAFVFRPFPLNKYREKADYRPTELLWSTS